MREAHEKGRKASPWQSGRENVLAAGSNQLSVLLQTVTAIEVMPCAQLPHLQSRSGDVQYLSEPAVSKKGVTEGVPHAKGCECPCCSGTDSWHLSFLHIPAAVCCLPSGADPRGPVGAAGPGADTSSSSLCRYHCTSATPSMCLCI